MAHALTAASPADGARLLASLEAILLDCDGVVWRGSECVPHVKAAVEHLEKLGKRVFYVSNNSTKSRSEYTAKLSKICGIHATEEQIVTSAVAAADYCKVVGVSKKAYVVGSAGLIQELQSVGITVVGPEDAGRSFAFGAITPADLDPDVEAVVVGFDGSANYYKLAMAASYLRYKPHVRFPDAHFTRSSTFIGFPLDPASAGVQLRCLYCSHFAFLRSPCCCLQVKFVATNRDLTFPDTHMLVPGSGMLVAAIEATCGRSPDVVAGKPSLAMLDILSAAHGLRREATAMVGDRLDTDILFGNEGKLAASVLVLTGVAKEADVAALPPADKHMPTHVLPSLGDLARLIPLWMPDLAPAAAAAEASFEGLASMPAPAGGAGGAAATTH